MTFPPPPGRRGDEGEDFDPFAPPSPFGSPEPASPPPVGPGVGDGSNDEWSTAQGPYGPPAPGPYQAPQGTPTYSSPVAPAYGAPPPVGYLSGAVASNQIATWALTLSILGLCCGFLSIAGFVLSLQAKQAVAQGRASNGGVATTAMVISVVTFVLSSLIVLANLTN